MRKLIKINLNFEKTLKYVSHQLGGGNTLSLEILRSVDFFAGSFFTLLPNDATLEKCDEFTSGGMLPQSPTEWYFLEGKMASHSTIPTIQEEVTDYIVKKATEDNLMCIFEDVLSTKKTINLDFFKQHSILCFLENEAYFIVNNKKIDNVIISKCLEKSNAIWHSLCILTSCAFKELTGRELSLEKIKEICLKTEMIIIGAYDGEGYLFWEKK